MGHSMGTFGWLWLKALMENLQGCRLRLLQILHHCLQLTPPPQKNCPHCTGREGGSGGGSLGGRREQNKEVSRKGMQKKMMANNLGAVNECRTHTKHQQHYSRPCSLEDILQALSIPKSWKTKQHSHTIAEDWLGIVAHSEDFLEWVNQQIHRLIIPFFKAIFSYPSKRCWLSCFLVNSVNFPQWTFCLNHVWNCNYFNTSLYTIEGGVTFNYLNI